MSPLAEARSATGATEARSAAPGSHAPAPVNELRDLAGLAAKGFAATVGLVEGMHRAIAGRSFRSSGTADLVPGQLHGAIAGFVYSAIRLGSRVAGTAGEAVMEV